jgi:hypothetical protein
MLFKIFNKIKNLKIFKSKLRKGNYISCKETVDAAIAENLSVCDYLEKKWNQVGETQKVIYELIDSVDIKNITSSCEIGPGTGRYIEKIFSAAPLIKHYSIYETAPDWAFWLSQKYNCIKRDANGIDLNQEGDSSIDLCHAHGVFVYLSIFNSLRYIKEMIRVCRIGGIIFFDYYNSETLNKINGNTILEQNISYPVIIPDSVIESFIKDNNCEIIKTFKNKHGVSFSIYIVAKKLK